jgi:hypothetical protein
MRICTAYVENTHQNTKEETDDGGAEQNSGNDGNNPVNRHWNRCPREPARQPHPKCQIVHLHEKTGREETSTDHDTDQTLFRC